MIILLSIGGVGEYFVEKLSKVWYMTSHTVYCIDIDMFTLIRRNFGSTHLFRLQGSLAL